jgi:hypothetical protein
MSEFQVIAFRACETPVSPKNLEYMDKQSSRAEITPWSFDNEYHYGDFHGNVEGMQARGYDLFVHYANFGVRRLQIRFPHEFAPLKVIKPYLLSSEPDGGDLGLMREKRGNAVTLVASPYLEPDDLDDNIDVEDLVNRMLPLRAELLGGDLRPLYLLHLGISRFCEEDPVEAPVPAGLDKPTDAQKALMEFYGIDKALVEVAAQAGAPLSSVADPRSSPADWLRQQASGQKDAWLARWMADANTDARSELMAAFQAARGVREWPTVQVGRKISEMEHEARRLAEAKSKKAVEQKAKREAAARAKRIAAVKKDPDAALVKTDELVKQRGGDAYTEAASILSELRDAFAGTDRAGLADKQAWRLHQQHPGLTKLTGALRKEGFIPKRPKD